MVFLAHENRVLVQRLERHCNGCASERQHYADNDVSCLVGGTGRCDFTANGWEVVDGCISIRDRKAPRCGGVWTSGAGARHGGRYVCVCVCVLVKIVHSFCVFPHAIYPWWKSPTCLHRAYVASRSLQQNVRFQVDDALCFKERCSGVSQSPISRLVTIACQPGLSRMTSRLFKQTMSCFVNGEGPGWKCALCSNKPCP